MLIDVNSQVHYRWHCAVAPQQSLGHVHGPIMLSQRDEADIRSRQVSFAIDR